MTPLVVHLNGKELYDVEPAATSFESSGSFAVELRNHGQAVHAHLRLDDDLSRVASLEGTNHFVDTGSATRVPVTVADGAPSVHGTLKVVTGYGSDTNDVEVHLTDGDGGEQVAVDENLGRPEAGATGTAGGGGAPGLVGSAADRVPFDATPLSALVDTRGARALATVVAVALAFSVTALVAAPGLAVVLGIFAVLVGVAVAAYLMVR